MEKRFILNRLADGMAKCRNRSIVGQIRETYTITGLQFSYGIRKALRGLCGVPYIYPIFFRFGLIEVPEKVEKILRGRSFQTRTPIS